MLKCSGGTENYLTMGGKGRELEKGKGADKDHHKSLNMEAVIYPVGCGFSR